MNIEANRFSKKANLFLECGKFPELGTEGIDKLYVKPYQKYYSLIQEYMGSNILDLCCGDGQFTPHIVSDNKSNVISVDLSNSSLLLFKERAAAKDFDPICVQSDMIKLPFKDNAFDIICIAGSLSYASLDVLIKEIKRVSNHKCRLIIVDSLNNNPIYSLYRIYHFLISKRSFRTIIRMPNILNLRKIYKCLNKREIYSYGAFTFIALLLKSFLPDKAIKNLVAEDNAPLSLLSYKIIITGLIK
jgi:ubiquinone/menaquinone biosynthesis C-methylase UbiE